MSQGRHRVLVVDDEPALRKALRTSLTASGFLVEEDCGGDEALRAFDPARYDLVLLDINMPGISGVETCRRLRAQAPEFGIVMVTVRDSEDDKLRALESGADDFVTKPYRFRELVARLKAVRRANVRAPAQESILRAGTLELDVERRVLKKAGVEIHLSPKEFDLIAYLIQHPGVPHTHAQLLRAVWGPEYGGELEYLRSYVRMLRKKIEDDPGRPENIVSEPWLGYRLRDPLDSDNPAASWNDAS